MATADIGLIGLAVMGSNLALNIAEKGYMVAAHNRTASKIDEFVATAKAQGLDGKIIPKADLAEFIQTIKRPRSVIIMVKAGKPVDEMIEQLLPHLEKGDAILSYQYPVQAWSLGNLSWIVLGGEVVIDYALRLRSEITSPLWVLGYSTDVMAYIPSERVLKEGRYEGATSMIPHGRPAPWTPGLEQKIVSKAEELVRKSQQ